MAHRRKVWVTGAGGLIGNYLAHSAPADFDAVGLTRQTVDLTDYKRVEALFAIDRPAAIIHCAALSRSPVCQEQPDLAWKLNFEVTEHLSSLACNIPFIFFSTDLVFDGQKGNYIETDEPNPLSVYAKTKAAAEKIVSKNPNHTIVRISLNGGESPTGDRGFNEEMRRCWRNGQSLKLFVDEFRSPTPAVITARAVWELLQQNRSGIYHIAAAERLSRFEIGQLIARRCPELNPKVEPGSLRDYKGAPRPPDTSLDCSKIQQLLSFPLPRFSDWLEENKNTFF